ncbi:MAG TPA: rhodanese-like domain-containing protein [Fimbriimonadaceae bacterium]|nr:rhodanese-like domain-containing protein [Fimbriimonadaceae bacterium]
MVPEVTVQELQRELASPNPPTVIDVREGDELQISRLPHFIHIPMMEIPNRLAELDPETDYAVLCRSGSRSARVTAYLLQSNFKRVRNVVGGINAWAAHIDTTLPQY